MSFRDVELGRLASVLRGHTAAVTGCDFAPGGNMLATASHDEAGREAKPRDGNAPIVRLNRDWYSGVRTLAPSVATGAPTG